MAVCMTISPPAEASGFAFNWEPFIIDEMLVSEDSIQEIFLRDSYISGINTFKNNHAVIHKPSDNRDVSLDQQNKRKSLLKNIKITIFPDGMTDEKNVIYHPYSDDERTVKLIRAITSLIYDDSKLKSLETIGNIVEPQIKLYFEF